jgi:hypothetical protein
MIDEILKSHIYTYKSLVFLNWNAPGICLDFHIQEREISLSIPDLCDTKSGQISMIFVGSLLIGSIQ